MREICMSGLMSGMWKRSMVRTMRHRQPKGSETAGPGLNYRATSRLDRSPSDRRRSNGSVPATVRVRSEWPPSYLTCGTVWSFSVSPSQKQTVCNYLATQAEHHSKWTFEQEYVTLLRKSGAPVDWNRVFD